jgi:hypothetical protein
VTEFKDFDREAARGDVQVYFDEGNEAGELQTGQGDRRRE